MMFTLASLLVDRRKLVAGLAAVAAPVALGARAYGMQSDTTAITDGDCTSEPSVQMLFDWRAGKPVYDSPADSGPQPDWIASNLPVPLLPYLIPPDWRAVVGYCDSISTSGEPQWTDQPMQLPWLYLARVLNNDSTAAFETISGNIQGQPLTPEQVSSIAKASLVGGNADLDPVCTIDDSANTLAPAYFAVDRSGENLLLTSVTSIGLPDIYLPATTVSITSMFGPRKEMEDLMHDVYLRILFQFLGGGGDETPTPTPTP